VALLIPSNSLATGFWIWNAKDITTGIQLSEVYSPDGPESDDEADEELIQSDTTPDDLLEGIR